MCLTTLPELIFVHGNVRVAFVQQIIFIILRDVKHKEQHCDKIGYKQFVFHKQNIIIYLDDLIPDVSLCVADALAFLCWYIRNVSNF